ncbi:MAG: hypothetical protein GY861_02515 [bacterium]|nr:hypothetical protein [bacterium]
MIIKHITFTFIILVSYIKLVFQREVVCNANSDKPHKCTLVNKCVDNLAKCPTLLTCPKRWSRCDQFTCKPEDSEIKCVEDECREKYRCWNGDCKEDVEKCPTMASCPQTSLLSARCHDNSCVASFNECPRYIECPNFIPIRCPTGDCRRRLEDCPTLATCPKEFPIKCNDGNCRTTNQECENAATQTQCPDTSMVRCPDGSCTSAKFLCPTLKTCPKNYVVCWDGNCISDISKCKKPETEQNSSCTVVDMIRCETDGSCRLSINQCPTGIICPISKPVKCWDQSCKESLDKCPAFKSCPEGTKECPDGTCSTNKVCGTHITCSNDSPYRCYDNTCRANPNDCPTMPECPGDKPILCWDGTCVKNRSDCTPPDYCPFNESVKCPNNMCKHSIEECKPTDDCPLGFIRCPSDGTCKKKLSHCIDDVCPVNFPVQCRNGMCVETEENCIASNNCPFYASFKCEDGSCKKNGKECSKKIKKCKENEKSCPDGSCLPTSIPCPLANGCPLQFSRKCADGSCIDTNKDKCHIPICPRKTPIKCSGGLCVKTKSNCPHEVKKTLSNQDCPPGLTLCDNGLCAKTFDQCMPTFSCPNGTERCGDGYCRIDKDYCPRVENTCPKSKPFRCKENGSCVEKSSNCINLSGCPTKTPIKCPSNGACVNNVSECRNIDLLFALANGCTISTPKKCYNGACVSDLKNCKLDPCPADKVFCPNNGSCAESIFECSQLGKDCPKGQIQCPDKSCKEDYMKCNSKWGCPMKESFRCLDGTCQPLPNMYLSQWRNGTCDSGLSCPTYKPFLCADGSCVQKSSFCTVLFPCPSETSYRCFDRTCARSADECPLKKRCPSQNPILCPNGNCVTSVFECNEERCPTTKPFKCISGECHDKVENCIFNTKVIPQCKENQIICQDGSCRELAEHCAAFEGCSDPAKPYKCPNGGCAASKDVCKKNNWDNPKNCKDGETRCEDGICRTKCPNFNGCTFENPLQCPNGKCVTLLSECAGISYCPIETPFECADGSCRKSIHECKRPKRTFAGSELIIFVYPESQIEAVTILGESNEILGGIVIPANTFSNDNSNSTFTILSYKSYSSNQIYHTKTKFHETRRLDIKNVLPFADKNNSLTLEYENAVLSPVVNVHNETYANFNNPIILSLAFDFPINFDNNLMDRQGLNPFKDVCLASLVNKTTWVCTGSKPVVMKYEQYQLFGRINDTGIYTVILNPIPDMTKIKVIENFLVKYSIIILVSTLVTVAIFVGSGYAFARIYRYRGKYKHTKDESQKKADKMVELSNISTSVIGQTLGDNLDNIVFMNNPSYKVEKVESKSNRTVELENLQESIQKKYRILEGNHEQLKKTCDTLTNELRRLKEYKEQ